MAQGRSSRTPQGLAANARYRRTEPSPAEVTDIIPFNEFGDLDDLGYRYSSAFDSRSEVLYAPELDDLDAQHDPSAMHLGAPSRYHPSAQDERYEDDYAYQSYIEDEAEWTARVEAVREAAVHGRAARKRAGAARRNTAPAPRKPAPGRRDEAPPRAEETPGRRGQHREAYAGAAKGRMLIVAMAAGAAAAAAHTAINRDHGESGSAVLSASAEAFSGHAADGDGGVQIITVKSVSNPVHREEFVKAAAYAEERAQREARLQRPLFVMPTKGIPTSAFGYRWGVLHAGIDIANSIGTPIYAVSDGVVIDAGPTAGYGMWVKLRHPDGTVTLYGHVNTTLVNIGERVMAGDQIATMGNRGNSTGPHLHFEVMPNGKERVDPVPWLAERGISVAGLS